ncbi:MAG: SDR family oxidoreductase [Alphaproteobacteria bacterium]
MTEMSPKTALVTGAGIRVGRAIALDLARHGWQIAVHYNRSRAPAEEVVDEIRAHEGRAVALRADLSHEKEASRLVPRAAEALGPLTCLVNNAARFETDTVNSATWESWDTHMKVNLRAPFVLIQAFAAQLPDGAAGNVINLIDQRVWSLTPDFTSYTVSKAGLWTLTRTLALALAPRIRVNAVGPAPILPSRRQTQAQFDAQCAQTPLGRSTTPEEITEAVRFILGAPALTGQMIALDGGQHLGKVPPDPEPPK